MIGSSIFPPPWDDTKVAANERRGRDICNVVFVVAGVILCTKYALQSAAADTAFQSKNAIQDEEGWLGLAGLLGDGDEGFEGGGVIGVIFALLLLLVPSLLGDTVHHRVGKDGDEDEDGKLGEVFGRIEGKSVVTSGGVQSIESGDLASVDIGKNMNDGSTYVAALFTSIMMMVHSVVGRVHSNTSKSMTQRFTIKSSRRRTSNGQVMFVLLLIGLVAQILPRVLSDDPLNGNEDMNKIKSSGGLRKGDVLPTLDNDAPTGHQDTAPLNERINVKAFLEEMVTEAKVKLPLFDLSKIKFDSDITQDQLIEAVGMIQIKSGVQVNYEHSLLERMHGTERRLRDMTNLQQDQVVFPTAYDFGSSYRAIRNGENKMFREVITRAHYSARQQEKYKKSTITGSTKKSPRHRQLQESGSCPTPCDIDDAQCNCERLYDCSSRISPTDLSVMYLNGYIQEDGDVTVDVNVFDGIVPEKVATINQLATAAVDGIFNKNKCQVLLDEFHAPCKGSSCSSRNDYSVQLTIDQVCDAVDSPIKLLASASAKHVDGLNKVRGPFVNDEADEYVSELDLDLLVMPDPTPLEIDCGRSGNIDNAVNCPAAISVYGDFVDTARASLENMETEWKESVDITDELGTYVNEGGSYLTSSQSGVVENKIPSQCDSVSAETCATFATYFQRLYDARDTNEYPLRNPMRNWNDRFSSEMDLESPSGGSIDYGVNVLNNVKFLRDNRFSIDSHGIRTHNGYIIADRVPILDRSHTSEGSWRMKRDKNWARCSYFLPNQFGFSKYSFEKYYKKCVDDDELVKDDQLNNDGTQADVEKHAVKCCSSQQIDYIFTERVDSLIDPEFTCPYRAFNSEQCPGPKTFQEAVDYCAQFPSGRLCSSEELYHGCAGPVEMIEADLLGSTGFTLESTNPLSCDSDLVWTAYTYDYGPVETGCSEAQLDPVAYSNLMQNCDDSMALLLGKDTSVGSLVKIVNAIEESNDPGKMPGFCCLDDATTSDFVGYNYDDKTNPLMECNSKGAWHLGISANACERAGGTYFRTPCVTLQECIEDRPEDGDAGFSRSFETFVKGTPIRSCSQDEDIECTTDEDCPESGSTCEITSYTGGFTIDDPSDEEQCRNARRSLNFDQDYIVDSDVCEDFSSRKCEDDFFDTLDALDEPLPTLEGDKITYTPPTFEEVKYFESIEIEALDDLQNPAHYEEKTYNKDREKKWKDLNTEMRALEKKTRDLQDDVSRINEMTVFCDAGSIYADPWAIIVTGFSIPNLAALGFAVASTYCYAGVLTASILAWNAYEDSKSKLDIIAKKYDAATTSPSQLKDGVIASVATYENSLVFYEWATKALTTTNQNVANQNYDMTVLLQARHETMEVRLNTYMACMTQYLGNALIEVVASVNGQLFIVPSLTDACKKTLLGTDGDRRALQGTDEDNEGPELPALPIFKVFSPDGTPIIDIDGNSDSDSNSDGTGSSGGNQAPTPTPRKPIYETVDEIDVIVKDTDGKVDGIIQNVLTPMKTAVDGMSDTIGTKINASVAPIKTSVSEIDGKVDGVVQDMLTPMKKTVDEMSDTIGTKINATVAPIESAVNFMQGEVKDIKDQVQEIHEINALMHEILNRTLAPTLSPSQSPSRSPTSSPSLSPSRNPSKMPSRSPTVSPSTTPSQTSALPSTIPSESPSSDPTTTPSMPPSVSPSGSPSDSPSDRPSSSPTVSSSPTSKSWYPDWQLEQCVQDCREEEGPNCGGLAEKWEKDELFSTAELCCEKKFNWISECPYESINARRLKEISEDGHNVDKSERKVVMQLKAIDEMKVNDLEMKVDLEEMKSRMATMEGDMKDMRDDMKEIKELLAQLVKE